MDRDGLGDAGMETLADLKRRKTLRLTDMKVTAAGMHRFPAVPGCKIMWQGGEHVPK